MQSLELFQSGATASRRPGSLNRYSGDDDRNQPHIIRRERSAKRETKELNCRRLAISDSIGGRAGAEKVSQILICLHRVSAVGDGGSEQRAPAHARQRCGRTAEPMDKHFQSICRGALSAYHFR